MIPESITQFNPLKIEQKPQTGTFDITLRCERLEAEDLVLELAHRASLGETQGLGSLLHSADHGRRTAEKNLDITGGSRETLLDHVSGNEANTTHPVSRRGVQDVVDVEVWVLGAELVKLLLKQNVLGVNVGEDQVNLGTVVAAVAGAVADDSLNNLEHGSDTGTTRDHTNVATHVGGVDHGTLGTADLHGLADLQLSQVLGDVTLGVSLDQQIEVTGLVVGGDGGVGTDDLLGLTGNSGGEGDVLADRETQDIGGTGQGKAVDGDIVRDVVDLLELEVLEFGRVQDLARLCWRKDRLAVCLG